MNTKNLHRVFIKRYTWLTDGEAVDGVALMHGENFRGFIPFTEIHRLSNKMVDLYESYEQQKADNYE